MSILYVILQGKMFLSLRLFIILKFHNLFSQGCDSEISSMVTEARSKAGRCVSAALRVIGHLSAVTGMEFHTAEASSETSDKVLVTHHVCLSLLSNTKHYDSSYCS